MTSGLRKSHKYIWLLLVFTMPILMILSVKDLNLFSSEISTIEQYSDSKKESIASHENAIVKASVFNNHIEIILKSTLKNSSSIVYSMDEKGNKAGAIGQLTTAGIYKFNIINLPKGILIYDGLKNVEITKFSFQWD